MECCRVSDVLTTHTILAPMEGVIDAAMRARLTGMGGYSRAVTEFVRVTNVLLPERVFFRLCPELLAAGTTPSGTPVYVQLLGSDPQALAKNAQRAVQLGAPGVDLNFGCPAKTVNNSMGGSVLLRQPELVAQIVKSVRDAVPAEIPVTAKIRLGYDNADSLNDIICGIDAAGATELAIHARTKFDGYKPPAYWDLVQPCVTPAADKSGLRCRSIINGEIWTVDDAHAASQRSGCRHIMLGRGALSAPDLAWRIDQGDVHAPPMPWQLLVNEVLDQFLCSDCNSERHIGNRTKQWLAYLRRTYPEARLLFQRIRQLHDVKNIVLAFEDHQREDLALGNLTVACNGATVSGVVSGFE